MSEIEDRGTSIQDPDGEGAEEEAAESGGKGLGIIVKLLLILVVFGGLGFGAYLLTQKLIIPMLSSSETVQAVKERLNRPKAEKKKKVKDRGDPIRHSVEGIVANLSGSRRSIVAFDLLLEVYSEEAKEELTDKDFQIRDAMLIYFGSRTMQEVATRQFLVTVRDTIKKMLNGFLEDAPIDTVYFTKFIFQ